MRNQKWEFVLALVGLMGSASAQTASGPTAQAVVDVVAQCGADPVGTVDSAPAVNACLALGSNHRFIFRPGTYLIKSLVKSPYPTVTGQQGFTLYGTAATPYNNITIEGYGATITTDNLHNNSNWFGLDYVNHLTIKGFTFAANPTGLSAGSEPSAFFLAHVTDARLEDISLTGNWGGSTRNPAFVAGNWLTDVVFDRINLPKMSLCFDLAFLRRVTFRDVKAVGANDSGGTSGGAAAAASISNTMQLSSRPIRRRSPFRRRITSRSTRRTR
jgi:hypothetical protein